jgi:hypothetical protein
VVLNSEAQRALADAEREFRGDPGRLVPLYYRLGMVTRALQTLPRVQDPALREQYRNAMRYALPGMR